MRKAHPLIQINLVVADLERSQEFYAVFGWELSPMGPAAARVELGDLTVSFHRPEFVPTWDAGYSGGTGSTTVLDIGLPSRAEVDRVHRVLVDQGHRSRQEPWETFWGEYYATVEVPDGHPLGLKGPLA